MRGAYGHIVPAPSSPGTLTARTLRAWSAPPRSAVRLDRSPRRTCARSPSPGPQPSASPSRASRRSRRRRGRCSAAEAVVAALAEHGELSRPDLLGAVARHGVDTAGERGSHLLRWLSARCVIVFAAPRGTQQRFALFEEWIPGSRRIDDREEALAEYVRRWLARCGPATVRDLAWWGGLTLTEARHAVSLVDDVEATVLDGETWIERTEGEAVSGRPARGDLRLLPPFDELLLGYGAREASLDPADASRLVPSSNGLFLPAVTVDGRVVGTWRRTVAIEVDPWVAWTERRRAQVRRRAEQYAQHLGLALAEGPASAPTSP
ncbi:winged helix DNA-binding domain-containing protein [Frigoribacterium sp. PhB107]|uniref:winged helix DNA-binding domain-containing protein n=1 Tax=Frigoribacterium sp. PhB107 TaxID=2485172 RepID=UPI000F47208E|nr:winged helix DNA-binding domain-containing protein [Frigoribacterium sp. PhB107]